MRRFALALVVAASATSASANPIDFLKGPILDGLGGPRTDWSGYYAGTHAATGVSDMDFSHATDDVVAKMLNRLEMESVGNISQWPVMGKKSNQSSGWGGFVGWNAQWDQALLGIELNYIKGQFGGADFGSMGRRFTVGTSTYNVNYEATAAVQLHDMGSARVRAGYAVGNFLPYAFGGISLGLADIVRSARVHGWEEDAAAPNDPPNPPRIIPFDYRETRNQNGHFVFGYAAGGGVDVMLFGNAFLRGEFEYLKFTSPIDFSVTTVRGGLGMKF